MDTPWREGFSTEHVSDIKKIIDAALDELKSTPLSRTNQVKKHRINNGFKKAYQTSFNAKEKCLDLSGREEDWYSTLEQVEHFVHISELPDFSGLEAIIRNHQQMFFQSNFNLVDYGCGNGIKSAYLSYLLNELSPPRKERKINLIDCNDLVLQIAQSVLEQLANKKNIYLEYNKPIDLNNYTVLRDYQDHTPRLHFLLGHTIGNFRNPSGFIWNIAHSMRNKEYLLVEWLNRSPADYEKGELGERMKMFLLNYFQAAGIPRQYLAAESSFMREDVDLETGNIWNIGSFRLRMDFTHTSGIELKDGTELIGFRSRRFKEKEITSLFQKQGLVPIDTTSSNGTNCTEFSLDGKHNYALFKQEKEFIPKIAPYEGITVKTTPERPIYLAIGFIVGITVTSLIGKYVQKPELAESATPIIYCHEGRESKEAIDCQTEECNRYYRGDCVELNRTKIRIPQKIIKEKKYNSEKDNKRIVDITTNDRKKYQVTLIP